MKLAIVIGTRPEIIRLSRTINLARKYFDVTLIHTGQNYDYELSEIFFSELEIKKPDYYLNCSKNNIGEAIGDIISHSYTYLKSLNPDALLILGDTNSCLCAYSAKRLKIPIFHLEAGNRCFDLNVPEEINRKIIDHISDINMCYMEQARNNLLKENIKSQYLFVIGSPIPEIYFHIKHKVNSSTILETYNLKEKEYFVWSTHREANIDDDENFSHIVNSINQLNQLYNKKIVFSVHPRTRKKLQNNNIRLNDNIILTKPLGLIDYLCLQKKSLCVISDSGTVTEEAKILKFKAILLRTSTEHPEGIDSGTVIIGNINWDILKKSINLCINLKIDHNKIINYEDINFSEKVCKIILSYYSIINKFIWHKN